jgi:hypothetical protein
LFGVIFKVLPDAKIKWKDVFGGALATSVLFMIGKLIISLYISKSDIGGAFGAAGSLVILIVWIYYSAIILYFGAEFTKAYAVKYGSAIHPNHYAVTVKKVEIEGEGKSVQEMDDVDVNNLPQKRPKLQVTKVAQKPPEPQIHFDKNRPPLGMLHLIQAFGAAALTKVSDLGKNDHRNKADDRLSG